VNLHDSSTLKWFDIPAFEVRAEYALAKYIERFKPDVIISPDRGSIERAKYVADLLNVKYDYFEKKRISGDKVVIEKKDIDVQGKVVAIVDDMISTGSTIIAAAQILKEQKAGKIVVGCIHGVFINNSLQKLEMYVDAIVSTNTIENEKSVVTVADLIYDQLMKNI
jgi:ribose-phosphate pyrophosphokinase